jgi:diguanylate cyclase (GGDEF)-like protein
MRKTMADQSKGEDPSAWCRPLLDGNVLALLICDAATREILEANDLALACLGRARAALAGVRLPDLYDPVDADAEALVADARRLRRPDGTSRHVIERHCAPCSWGAPARCARLVLLEDVSGQAQSEARWRATIDELQRAHALARIGTWAWNATTDVHHTDTPHGHRLLGLRDGDVPLTLEDVTALIHPDDRDAVMRSRDRALRDPACHHDVEFRLVRPDGVLRWVRAIAEVQRDAAGRPVRMFGLVQDMTDRRLPDDRVRRLAYYDAVTGLPNRNLFEQSCADRIERLADGGSLACMIVDLVRFRDVNYALTHSSGDVLLGLVAERLTALVGQAGLVAHVDARFPILLHDVDEEGARQWAHAVHRAFEAPFAVAGISYELGARIGIALAPSDGGDDNTLLRKADVALYQASSAGRNLAVYASGDDPHTPGRLALIGDFRAAIESRQIRLFCQPKVDLKRGEIVGVEALVRWVHPDKGIIGPEVFMPLIESTELVHVLTRHMLASAVAQCEEWRRQGVHLPVAVNLSARDLAALTLSDHLEALMDAHRACSGMIGLEMTESSLMQDPDASIAELERLSRMGFRLYVDDFGTGYSSLSYLSRLPVDVIKIDHGFTMKMIRDRRAAAIVKSTIHLAHDLGMTVVAEGVSERPIWDALCALGCDEAQGYHIAMPMPAADVLAWARQSPYALLAATGEQQAALA